MHAIGKLALLLALVLSFHACGGAFVSFSPAPLSGEVLNAVTGRAVEVRPEDQPYLIKANAVLVGWVHTDQGDTDSTSEAVRDEAARSGGTHVFVPGNSQWDGTLGDTPSRPRPDMPTVRTTTSDVRYAVYRVPPEAWEDLPSDLVPWPLSSFRKR